MIDSGSSHTVINHEAAKLLKSKFIYKEKIIIENMHGEEHYDAYRCQFTLPKDTIIEAYSVDTELCPVEMDQHLVNKFWPNLEDNIMHDVTRSMFNGPTDILIGIDNYWKLELTNILPHDSHRFGR